MMSWACPFWQKMVGNTLFWCQNLRSPVLVENGQIDPKKKSTMTTFIMIFQLEHHDNLDFI